MTQEQWLVCFLVGLVVFAEAFLYVRRTRALADARTRLRAAKQEVEDIAQLPLNNPHPLIQISPEEGTILFANLAAIHCFRGILEGGLDHPVLKGLAHSADQTVTREVAWNDHVYHQTIMPTRFRGEAVLVVYCHDVTDRKKHEQDLRHARNEAQAAQQAAEHANRARGDFLANMSHELRTPMNGIIGLSDILVETTPQADQRELIEAVNSSARNLLILLNDILDFSKIEAGELTIESIPFDIRALMRQTYTLQCAVAARKSLIFEVHVAPDVPHHLVGDPSRLQQILNNLVGNALKFTKQGAITLSVDGHGDGKGNFITRISVKDTGIGIAPDRQQKVFAKFQQADTSTAREYGGTGLGLAITKDLAELMGGAIALDSALGKGTTFTVTIPMPVHIRQQETSSFGGVELASLVPSASFAAPPIHSAPSASPAPPAPVVNTAARILVVDDHPVNLLYMRKMLAGMGFQSLAEAANGRKALALARDNAYDLILLDCQMPEMDGFTVARAVRSAEIASKDAVIIAVTANAMKGTKEECLAAGMNDYISKPINKGELRLMLQAILPPKEGTDDAPNAPINLDHLQDFTEGDEGAEAEIITLFMDILEVDLVNLQDSFDSKNYQQWDAAVHKLYGAASHVGAETLARLCDEGQTLYPADQTASISTLHPRIVHECHRVKDHLSKRRA